ncbi:MAG: hypothetical protein JOZ51_21190 [Chloroflexi bacterium]|nr:hypothetical protein [Chloroflexota bacterium]
MPLPERVAIKFEVYTLACRALLNRLCDLRMATQADPRLDYDTCLQRFDEALERFFMRADPADRHQAARKLAALLRVEVDLFRYNNTRVAAIFDDVIATLETQICAWSYERDLEQLHQQGRQLAQRFFAASPWPVTQLRLSSACDLIVAYGAAPVGSRGALLAESFGYRAAPAAYYPTYWDDDQERERQDVVLLRFSYEHSFGLYLAYPFLLLHEYTAHVHATDYDNEAFNDGWLLHAAAAFLHADWNHNPERSGLDLDQANIFYDRLYPRLNPIPRRACRFARDFESWLPDHLRFWFSRITFELAAFQPGPDEQRYWPTQALHQLERAFTTDRRRMLYGLENTTHLRDLLRAIAVA